jgi:hypothetical protein
MWPFRTDGRVLDLTRKLKSAANAITRLRGLAELFQLGYPLRRDVLQVDVLQQRVAAGPDAVTVAIAADNDRLARELTAVRQELAGLQRRWDGHAAVCPVAQQLDDVDRDKALENGS